VPEKVPEQITQLLTDWSAGDQEALKRLMPLVYDELRRLAKVYFQRQPPNSTLQGTALVHEAYLRLADKKEIQWQDRSHFFAVSARIMRCILVDHARSRGSAKRGGGNFTIALDDAVTSAEMWDVNLVSLDEALSRLGAYDRRLLQVVELRFFGGLSIEETSQVLNIAQATVKRHWNVAKAWIYREIGRGSPHAT
jgi:RNA polymerase sigma-70 factor (ECF subfamily)